MMRVPHYTTSSERKSGPVAGRQVHDASIIVVVPAHGEARLLSANRDDFARFESRIEVVEP